MSPTERRISLDTGIAQGMPDLDQWGGEGARRDAPDADRRAFEQALARDGQRNPDKPENAGGALAVPSTPFALFGGVAAGASQPEAAPSELAQHLAQAADRLLVGDGSAGRREVRIQLKDEVLPGVTVSVHEDEGRLVVAFVCASEVSRERLNACAQALADELARSLGRAALVRVSTDDPDDPCLYEVAAAA